MIQNETEDIKRELGTTKEIVKNIEQEKEEMKENLMDDIEKINKSNVTKNCQIQMEVEDYMTRGYNLAVIIKDNNHAITNFTRLVLDLQTTISEQGKQISEAKEEIKVLSPLLEETQMKLSEEQECAEYFRKQWNQDKERA